MAFIALLLCCLATAQVLAIRPRVLQGCTTLDTNVYCYGGYVAALGGRFVNATNDLYTVDLSKVSTYSASAALQWSFVNSSSFMNSTTLEPRAAMGITSLNETHYMISGGESDGRILANSTIVFDSTTNTSMALSAPPYSTYAGSLVATNSGAVWGYGGQLTNSSGPAPNSILKLNLSTLPETWSTLASGSFAPTSSRYGHTVALKNTMIYYFGGFFAPGPGSSTSQPVSFKTIHFYNTATDQWGVIQSSGLVPSSRKYHTATFVDDNSLLIYGGAGVDRPQSLPVLDYSYIFSTTSHTYRKLDLTTGSGAGPRSGHSAVLYRQTIFILFGYDSSGNLRDDAHLLDISDPTDPTWAGTSSYGSAGSDSFDAAGNNIKIIIGSVVGGVAFLLVVIAGVLYRCRQKRSNRAAYQHCQSSSPQNRFTELAPISSPPPPHHDHNGATPPEYPSEPAPRYSLHAPPATELSKANLYASR